LGFAFINSIPSPLEAVLVLLVYACWIGGLFGALAGGLWLLTDLIRKMLSALGA